MPDITAKLIKKYTVYHTIMYVFVTFSIVMIRVMGFTKNTAACVSFAAVVLMFGILDSVFYHTHVYENIKIVMVIRIVEITAYSIFVSFISPESMLLVAVYIFIFILMTEFIILGSHYDKGTIFARKMILLIPVFINLCLSLHFRKETFWFCAVLMLFVYVAALLENIDTLEYSNDAYETYFTKLVLERNSIQEKNEKLEEYQEKVKTVNEKVNYQKIELARVVNDLEQANKEIESQTEIMRYMASSFDMFKNLNVIVDAIVDVKNPKVCAVYLDKSAYAEAEYETCIIKTDYSSLERRLRKDFDKLYRDFLNEHKTTEIITGPAVKEFRFIGETNIKSIAMLALIENNEQYGLMLIASDEESFFEKGIGYYETCLVEYNISVKSTKLYLQTQDMARKDGLTKIYNRVYFSELFQKAAKEAEDNRQPISVALFDIDKFKNVNDTYGHLAGDKVIKMVASIDDKYAKQHNGFACRFGGEEFLLVLPGYDEKATIPILEAMHEEIKQTPVEYDDLKIHVNVCIGVSSYPNLCSNVAVLVNRADKSMYYGKRHGRGRLVVDNPSVDEEA